MPATSSASFPSELFASRVLTHAVGQEQAGQRLDSFLALACEAEPLSRSRVKDLIRGGLVTVNGDARKAGYVVRPGDAVLVIVPPPVPVGIKAEYVSFDRLYEDDDIFVLAKPPGIVVHPACGHDRGTLVHGLLYRCETLAGISGELRPGIVHRLDKDTSGVMVVAKHDAAHVFLTAKFKSREVEKVYHAILNGCPPALTGTVDLPIGRHAVHRKKMAIRPDSGRAAVTNWRVLEKFPIGFSYVEVRPETGRTHQIRVHMAYSGCPVAGDEVYGRKNPAWTGFGIKRQCLHASALSFPHPRSGEMMRFAAPIWEDMAEVLRLLRLAVNRRG